MCFACKKLDINYYYYIMHPNVKSYIEHTVNWELTITFYRYAYETTVKLFHRQMNCNVEWLEKMYLIFSIFLCVKLHYVYKVKTMVISEKYFHKNVCLKRTIECNLILSSHYAMTSELSVIRNFLALCTCNTFCRISYLGVLSLLIFHEIRSVREFIESWASFKFWITYVFKYSNL